MTQESYRKLGSLPASPQVSGVMTRVSDKTPGLHDTAEGSVRPARAPLHASIVPNEVRLAALSARPSWDQSWVNRVERGGRSDPARLNEGAVSLVQ